MRIGKAWFGIEASKRRIRNQKLEDAARELDKDMKTASKFYKKRLINACTQQQLSYMMRNDLAPSKLRGLLTGKRKFQQVRLADALYSETELWFRVITEDGNLPFGTGIEDFVNPDFAKNLALSTFRPTRVEWDDHNPDRGLWLVVEVEGSVRGLPSELPYSKAYDLITASRPPLTFPLG